MYKIGIIGGGIWGAALAKLLSNHRVCIYARDEKTVKSINENKIHPKLKYTIFSENVSSTLNLNDLETVEYVFIALPSQEIRQVLTDYTISNNKQQIIIASKGIEVETGFFLSQVVKEVVNTERINVLSGPCFLEEIYRQPAEIFLIIK